MGQNLEEDKQVVQQNLEVGIDLEEGIDLEAGIDLEVLDHEYSRRTDCKGMEMKGNCFCCPFADQLLFNF